MKTPADDLDEEDFDNVEDYIAAAMEEGYTIEAEDFEGEKCDYCFETIPFTDWPDAVVTWDLPVQEPDQSEPDPYVARYYFCSESCRKHAQRDEDWIRGNGEYADVEADRIHVDDLEGMA